MLARSAHKERKGIVSSFISSGNNFQLNWMNIYLMKGLMDMINRAALARPPLGSEKEEIQVNFLFFD